MKKGISLVLGLVVVSAMGSIASADPIDACASLPAAVGSQEVLGHNVPGVSDVELCVWSATGATGEPKVRQYEGCGQPCFAVVVRNLKVDIHTAVTLRYSLDGKQQDPIPVTTGQTGIAPLDGIHNCVYSYHAPGTPSPCKDGISNPSNLRATGERAKIALAWNKAFAFGESNVAGYEIYRSDSGVEGTFTLLATTTWTSFTDVTVARGGTYHYSVIAFDDKGSRSGASNPASATAK